jgi:hypothetical protein
LELVIVTVTLDNDGADPDIEIVAVVEVPALMLDFSKVTFNVFLLPT